jgi:hypothetical protein
VEFCGFCGFCDFSESAWVWINWVLWVFVDFVDFVGFSEISMDMAQQGFVGFWWVLGFYQMLVLQCLGSNSATWFNTAVLVTCMRNFPHSRGTVVGILKGFVGLSAAIFAQVYVALLSSNSTLLLLFLAVVPTAVCLASMLLVRPVPVTGNLREPQERRNFNYITAVCIALAGYLLIVTFTQKFVAMPDLIPVVLTAIMTIFLVAPLAIPIKTLSEDCYGVDTLQEPLLQPSREPAVTRQEGTKVTVHEDVVAKLNQEEDDAETLLAVGEGAVKRPKRRPRRGEDFKLRQALVKADFWLFFLTFFCGVGTRVTVINNLGQISEAQGYYNVNIFVSLISIANFLGRLGGGSLSEHYIRSVHSSLSKERKNHL